MNSFINNLSPKEWETFCEVMLRYHFGQKNFYPVPDQDSGDLGIEFYTADGTIFQCYYPDQGIEMSEYKKRIKKKIHADLKKLSTNETKIKNLLDETKINQWVLLTPENKSKDLIPYCNKKKKYVIGKHISYIDEVHFSVRIETANSFPEGKLYAQGVYNKAIDIPLQEVTSLDKSSWQSCHSVFNTNIKRKSLSLMGEDPSLFQDKVVTKYIQINKFLDQLRTDHPDLHELIEDSARAQLENMQEESLFESDIDKKFVQGIVKSNKNAFAKHSKFMSDKNMQSLSFGYLSKWIAECYMDFNK
jgi:hypothetical protein